MATVLCWILVFWLFVIMYWPKSVGKELREIYDKFMEGWSHG